jgi:23S rRNA pseudouridine1911/1915/1917 synthase
MKKGFFKIFVSKEHENERLDIILKTVVSRRFGKKLLQSGAVFVDNKRVKVASKLIKRGSVITGPTFLPKPPEDINWDDNIIYQDNNLVVINKPELWATTPTLWGEKGSISFELTKYLKLKTLFVVQRLDLHTSGTIVFAKNKNGLKYLEEVFKTENSSKIYWALTSESDLKPGIIEFPLGKNHNIPGRFKVDKKGVKAVTEIVEVKKTGEGKQLLKIKLHTGKTHQIRVHLSHLGIPVLGDPWYGNFNPPMYLHSFSLSITHNKLGKHFWQSPLPDYWPENLT